MSREEFFRPQRPVATFPYDSCLRGWLEARRNPLEERRYALGERRYLADTRTSPLPKQYRSSPQAVQVLSSSEYFLSPSGHFLSSNGVRQGRMSGRNLAGICTYRSMSHSSVQPPASRTASRTYAVKPHTCLLYTSPSPRDRTRS